MKSLRISLSALVLGIAILGIPACEQQSPEVMVPKKDKGYESQEKAGKSPEAANPEPPEYIQN